MELDNFAIVASVLLLPYRVGLLLVLVTTSCRVGMHVGIVDNTYNAEIRLGFAVGLGLIAYAIAADVLNYLG